jgi:hypothetical protein
MAATVFTGRKYAHAAFNLLLNLTSNGQLTHSIGKGSARAKILQQCRLTVQDDSTVSLQAVMENSDCTLQGLQRNKLNEE